VEYSAGKILLSGEGPGRLVLAEVWYPGWRVKIDGKEAAIFRVANIWMGVELPEGHHQIEFSYLPILQLVGIAVSIACWAAVWILAWLGRRQ